MRARSCNGPASAQHRQQHRRTLDGRLCAAAFVFDRQTHTGCSDGTNPAGEHGREWCYVDAQVAYSSEMGVRCLDRAFSCCVACSCWVAVVGSPRGVIAVLDFMRRARLGAARQSSCIQWMLPSSARASVCSAWCCISVVLKCFVMRPAPRALQRLICAMRLPALFVARLAAADYEALRLQANSMFASKIEEVRGSIAAMQKAQRAAEQALDMCCC